jgi:2-dehydropantoate 2-reductase
MSVAETRIRIGVMGAGAIGCFVGGSLAAHGADVVFVGRERLRTEIRETGLVVSDMTGKTSTLREVAFELEASALADCDVVLCAVKSAATAETAQVLAGVLSPGTIVVSLQNGVRNASVLREHMKGQTVLGAVVGFNVVAPGHAVFRQTTTGLLAIEASTDARVKSLVQALHAASLDVELVPDIRAVQYAKLVMNVNNAVGALTDVPTRRLVFEPQYRRILATIMGEAVDVMRAAGIRPARLGAVPASLLPLMLRLPTPILRIAARAQLKIDPEARSSMWDDLSKGRITEVDELNGEIVRLAKSCGACAPINQRVVDVVHEAERANAGSPKLTADALWAALTTG